MSFLKQRNIGTLFGTAKIIIGQVTPYVSWISLGLVGIMSFYTTISPMFTNWGILLPFWVFLLVLGVIIIGVAIMEWVFMLPSYYGASNVQSWEHENPQRDKLEKIEQDIAEIKQMLKDKND
jgi:Zn-dependent membrane protease YugP